MVEGVQPTKKGKSQKKNGRQEQLKLAHQVAEVMSGFNPLGLPEFGHLYQVIIDDFGIRRNVKINRDKVVKALDPTGVTGDIASYFKNQLAPINPDCAYFTPTDIDTIYKLHHITSLPFPHEVAGVAERSFPGYTYQRLPYDLDNFSGDFPTFRLLFNAFQDNVEAIQAWIGSLFDPDADRSQYVWLYGNGGDGKGRLIHFLTETLGEAHGIGRCPKPMGDQFWMSGIYNKRLVTFNDVNRFDIVRSEEVKTITGDDYVNVEFKQKTPFKARTVSKLLFASNHAPDIQDFESDLRRIIYSQVMVTKETDKIPGSEFNARLKAEGHAFLSHCFRLYKNLCPKGSPIPIDREAAESLAAGGSADFNEIVEDYFVIDPDVYVKKRDFSTLCAEFKWSPGKEMAFLNWLKKKYPIKYGRPNVAGSQEKLTKGFWGIGINAAHRHNYSYPYPKKPHWSVKDDLEWQRFVESLGHRVSGKAATGTASGRDKVEAEKMKPRPC